MNQKPANRLPSKLLQAIIGDTAFSPSRLEQTVNDLPELVFRSPTFKEIFGNTTLVILIIAFGFPLALVSGVAFLAGYNSLVLGALALPGLALISLVSFFLLQTGRVVLKSDKLIEYNLLNHPRVFTYAQIYEVKRGAHADQTWIRYYSLKRNGRINFKSIRGRNLISVRNDAELRHELSQRITAPPPILSQTASYTWIFLLLGGLVLPFIVVLFYLLEIAFSKR
jgi:hypothetical protein